MEKRTRFIFALTALAAGSACCEAPVAAVSPVGVWADACSPTGSSVSQATDARGRATERFAYEKY